MARDFLTEGGGKRGCFKIRKNFIDSLKGGLLVWPVNARHAHVHTIVHSLYQFSFFFILTKKGWARSLGT